MQRNVVSLGVKRIDGEQLDAQLLGSCWRQVRVAADESHAEGARAMRCFRADPAQADNAERLAGQLRTLQTLLFPLAGVHAGVGRGQLARQGQHQAQRELGHGHGVGAGRVHHHNAAARGSLGVNVVHAHAGTANHA